MDKEQTEAKWNEFKENVNLQPKTVQELVDSLRAVYESDGSKLTRKESLILQSGVVGGIITLLEALKNQDTASTDKIIDEVNKFMNQ
jgi:hypothetical protein